MVEELRELSPFSVFCALWLGITERDAFAQAGAGAVAERFGLDQDQLEAFLEEHDLRREDLRAASFDLESARLDIRVAPEGISRCELARHLFKEFRDGLANGGGEPDAAY